jgi:hypothetical protein
VNDLDQLAGIFDAIEPWRGDVPEGFRANVLGVLTARAFAPREGAGGATPSQSATGAGDFVERPPCVSDGEAFFEWANIVAAVRAARSRFTMVELGAGYAARSVDANALLKRFNPLPAFFVVVDGSPHHIEWAKRHFAANGLDPAAHWFVHAVVNLAGQPQLFAYAPGVYYSAGLGHQGAEEVLNAIKTQGLTEKVLESFILSGRTSLDFPMPSAPDGRFRVDFTSGVKVEALLAPLDAVDLMDVDIQNAEAAVIPDAMPALAGKVRRLHIGTHTHAIHGELELRLAQAGWEIVFTYPPDSLITTPYGEFTTSDGILTVLNRRLS